MSRVRCDVTNEESKPALYDQVHVVYECTYSDVLEY